MNTATLLRHLEENASGTTTFPQSVQLCLEEGIERYDVDFQRMEVTYYPESGGSLRAGVPLQAAAPAQDFSAGGVKEAIRAAQADAIRWPEFVRRAAAAGCVGYTVFIRGRQVRYDGRDGAAHVELFPGQS